MLHIVHALLDGPRGFNELGRDVGGCNPTTLRQRLVALQDVGLVTRHGGDEGAARTTYALTPAGEGLRDVIGAIHTWSLQHLHSTRAPRPVPTETGRGPAPRRPAGTPTREGGPPIAVEAAGPTDGS